MAVDATSKEVDECAARKAAFKELSARCIEVLAAGKAIATALVMSY